MAKHVVYFVGQCYFNNKGFEDFSDQAPDVMTIPTIVSASVAMQQLKHGTEAFEYNLINDMENAFSGIAAETTGIVNQEYDLVNYQENVAAIGQRISQDLENQRKVTVVMGDASPLSEEDNAVLDGLKQIPDVSVVYPGDMNTVVGQLLSEGAN